MLKVSFLFQIRSVGFICLILQTFTIEARPLTEKELLKKQCQVALALFERYPPDQFVILGLGRTVGVTLRCLQAMHGAGSKDHVWEVNIKNLRNYRNLQADHLKRLFKRIAPPLSMLGDRKIVVFRYLLEGHTIYPFIFDFLGYLKSQGYNKRLHAYYVSSVGIKSRYRPSAYPHADTADYQIDFERVEPQLSSRFRFELFSSSEADFFVSRGTYLPSTISQMVDENFSRQQNPAAISIDSRLVAKMRSGLGLGDCLQSLFQGIINW